MAGELEVFTRVQARDNLGRYIAGIPEKCRRALEKTATQGANVARAAATVKTGAMAGSVQPVVFSDYNAAIVVGTDHWKYQEYGTGPHGIPGNVSFYWANRGRRWVPGNNTISHPGNPAVHFMEKGAAVAKARLMDNLRAEF